MNTVWVFVSVFVVIRYNYISLEPRDTISAKTTIPLI